MKACSKCGKIKEDSEFFWKNKEKGVLHSYCKECKRELDRKSYKEELAKCQLVCSNCHREIHLEDGLKEERCECCGLSEWMGKPIPLELHHKDFNHYNNSLENLQILCANCHMQAHNYCNSKK